MMMTRVIPCDAFDALLPDYMEQSLDSGAGATAALHIRNCERCAGLVRDLDDIRARAAELPLLSPGRDLWAGVADRLSVPVTSLDARRQGARPARTRRWVGDRAIAAGLLLATAAGTFTATRWWTLRQAPVSSSPAIPHTQTDTAGRVAVGPPITTPVTTAKPTPTVVPATPPRVVRNVANKPSATITYEREIDGLRSIVRDRRTDIDPKTLSIVERNLTVIDSAIAESRAALRKDPRSRFLVDQLDHALDTKLELLRTVALLPART